LVAAALSIGQRLNYINSLTTRKEKKGEGGIFAFLRSVLKGGSV
jgi:hypothetical protein